MTTFFSLDDTNEIVLKAHSYISRIGTRIIDDKVYKGSSILEGGFYSFLDLLEVVEERKDLEITDDKLQLLILRLYSIVENQCVYYNSKYLDLDDPMFSGSVIVTIGNISFLQLTDTPDSYIGQAGKIVSVNNSEDGLIFLDPTVGQLTNANNGLENNSSIVQLGGDLIKQTSINFNGIDDSNDLSFVGTDNDGQYRSVANFAANINQLQTFDDLSGEQTGIISVPDRLALIHYNNSDLLIQALQITTASGIVITDQQNTFGTKYAANYFTLGSLNDRWIPDWGAVKSIVPSVLTFSNGLTKSSSNVALGGLLLSTTIIDTSSNSFNVQNSTGATGLNIDNSSVNLAGGNTNGSIDGVYGNFYSDATSTSFLRSTIISGVSKSQWLNFDATHMYVYDQLNSTGLIYGADYELNFVPRSLVTKQYVDGVIPTTITSNNGLTKTGSNIQWGGSLVQNVDINQGAHMIEFHGTNVSQGVDFFIDDTAGGSSIGLETNTNNTTHGKSQITLQSGGGSVSSHIILNTFSDTTLGQQLQIYMSNSAGISITDTINNFGMGYSSDYSTSGLLNDRWIPDIGAVRSLIPSVSGFIPYTGASSNIDIGNHYIVSSTSGAAFGATNGLAGGALRIANLGYDVGSGIPAVELFSGVTFGSYRSDRILYSDGTRNLNIIRPTLTTNRTINWPDNDGTVALVGDIRGSYTYATTDTITNLQAFSGADTKVLVTDSARGGEFYYSTSSLTADSGTIFAATGKGSGYWVRSYDLIQPIDMAWFGVSGSNSTTVNEGIINTYMTANVSAYISFPSNLVNVENLTLRNTTRVRDTYLNREVYSGQSFGQSTGAAGYHLIISPVQGTAGPSGTARLHIEPNKIMASGSTVSKLDLMGDPFNSDTVNYRILNLDWFNDNTNANAGVGYIGVKGVGNYFGKFPALHFGFNDNAIVPMKVQYYDYADTQWHTPMLGRWYTGQSITSGDYVTASNHLYQSGTTGTTGATVPSHTSGSVSDGTVTWTFIKDYSGSESNNFKASVIFGDKTSQGLTNIPLATRVQFLGDSIVGNGYYFNYVDNTNAKLWSIGVPLNDSGLNITSTLGGYLRFNNVGQNIQSNNLSWLSSTVTITNNSATPSITGVEFIIFSNTNPTTITSFANAQPYQRLTVQGGLNGNTTLQNNANIVLAAGEDLVLAPNTTIYLQSNSSGVFYQDGNRVATSTQGGLVSSTTQTFNGAKTITGNITSSQSVSGTGLVSSLNSNSGTGADSRIGADNGTVNVQLIMRGTGFTTNANNAYLSVTGSGLLGFLMNGTQRMTLLSNGQFGHAVAAPTSLVHIGASTTARASLTINNGVAPTTPITGDMWYTTPNILYYDGTANRTIANLDGTQTFSNKTFTAPALGTPVSGILTNATGLPLTTGVTGILPIANGGTGSSTQNFVDLTTTQSAIAGVKTWTGQANFNALVTASGGTASGTIIAPTITAAANSDVGVGLDVIPTYSGFGAITTTGSITGGSSYTNGTYNGVAVTDNTGNGFGATANVIVSGNAVTTFTIVNGGNQYKTTSTQSVLTVAAALIGGTGSGFTVPVTGVNLTSTVIEPLRVRVGLSNFITSSVMANNTMTMHYLTVGNNPSNSNYFFRTDGGSDYFNAPISTGSIFFRIGNSTAMVVLPTTGNVGIGVLGTATVDNSTDKLQVSGGTISSGLAGTTLGGYKLSGNTSGTIAILPQAAAGSYNFNLPTTVGIAGQVLTSQAGGSTPMTWTTLTAVNRSHTIFTPTTGGTVTLITGQINIINPAGTIATLTITLPSSPSNNDIVNITFTQAVTAITYAGGTVVGGPTTASLGGQWYLTYDSGTTTWY